MCFHCLHVNKTVSFLAVLLRYLKGDSHPWVMTEVNGQLVYVNAVTGESRWVAL